MKFSHFLRTTCLRLLTGLGLVAPLHHGEVMAVPMVGDELTFTYSGTVETFVVPAGVTSIRIDARGAQGGGSSNGTAGGRGARMTGNFAVIPGQVLSIVVGQQGQLQTGGNVQNSSGGGGGSFVYLASGPTLFVAAGGGGGKCNYTGSGPLHADADGQVTEEGGDSSDGNAGGSGGNGGAAGIWSGNPCSGGGTGWLTQGGGPFGGQGFATWTGGPGFGGGGGGGTGGVGGFGGGGGGGNHYGGGGGGGGYSGGSGGTDPTHGGGGGSYSIGTDQDNTPGFQEGDGTVILTLGASAPVSVESAKLQAPANAGFPATRMGRSSRVAKIRIGNSGGASISNLSAALSGAHSKDFEIVRHPKSDLDGGSRTEVHVLFRPKSTGKRTAFILLQSSVGPVKVKISGRGLRRQGTNSPRYQGL